MLSVVSLARRTTSCWCELKDIFYNHFLTEKYCEGNIMHVSILDVSMRASDGIVGNLVSRRSSSRIYSVFGVNAKV